MGDGEQALRLLRELRPDVAFLDIGMPGMSGVEVAKQAAGASLFVFVTAYDEHALRAFEVSAVDYLLKPVEEERFRACLLRVERRIRPDDVPAPFDSATLLEAHRRALRESESRYLKRLTVPARGGHRVVEVGQIAWVEARDYYSALHVQGKAYLVKISLSRLAEQLDPQRFVRVHRSTIVM